MMKICSKCGVEKPIEMFQWRNDHDAPRADCKACVKIRADVYRARNLEAHNARSRAWAKANPEKTRVSVVLWNRANPARLRAMSRKWQREHPETARAYRRAHAAEIRARTQRWQETNRDKSRAWTKAWAAANPDKQRARSQRWYTNNPGGSAAKAQWRHAQKLRATPAWADQDAIRALYELAAQRTRETGIKHHVDHQVPLKHPLVSGFHVENNLQVIPAAANMAKGNRHWPDMPEELRA